MNLTVTLMIALLASVTASAQQPAPPKQADKGIQDNSFLVEEAYNQEKGVVQHISTFTRQRSGDLLFTFTQEWPVFSPKHQFSYTIPIGRLQEAPNGGVVAGDVALNYRYQLIGNGDTRLAVSPRFTLLLPIANEKRGLGEGATGFQVNLPVSAVISDRFVTHWNAGATYTPSSRSEAGEEVALNDYNLGGSLIWLPSSRFNVMLETVWFSEESAIGSGLTERSSTVLVNPGIRWAHNFKSGLQIVPGISVPIGVGPSRGDRSIFFYLSFEHPIRRK